MIESDTTVNINFLKMTTHNEFSQFETNSNQVYSMINPDEHDRILTDPAYRMERTMQMQNKLGTYFKTLENIEKDYIEQNGGLFKIPYNKMDYVTMIEVEKAILKMDRLFNRVDKFNARKFTDLENHERREKRMRERAAERWDKNYTFFVGELTEEEQKYNDYFETDLEKNPEFEPL